MRKGFKSYNKRKLYKRKTAGLKYLLGNKEKFFKNDFPKSPDIRILAMLNKIIGR